jgi:hypothetical protein
VNVVGHSRTSVIVEVKSSSIQDLKHTMVNHIVHDGCPCKIVNILVIYFIDQHFDHMPQAMPLRVTSYHPAACGKMFGVSASWDGSNVVMFHPGSGTKLKTQKMLVQVQKVDVWHGLTQREKNADTQARCDRDRTQWYMTEKFPNGGGE